MNDTKSRATGILKVGERAPEFSLPDQEGNQVSLSDFRGEKNVVLIFYPGDDTPGCTKQLCNVRDQYATFGEHDSVVFGINPQGSKSHMKFIAKYSLPFPLLVDAEKAAVSAYGCQGMLATERTVYGINKEGKIVFAQRGKPANEEILESFKR